MDDDWDDEPVNSGSSTPAPIVPPSKPAARTKWANEDVDEEAADEWDASEDEKPKAAPAANTTAIKKKSTLKQKLAEKEKLAAEARARGDVGDDLVDTMTEQERRRLARDREIEADLAAARDLMGSSSIHDGPETLQSIVKAAPKSKEDFASLSKQIMSAIISRHETNPLFPAFAEQLAKDVCESLTAVQTRKISTAVSVLGNAKQQDERDKQSGKKKVVPTKPKLGSAKAENKVDIGAYDDVLEDDDFM